MRIRPFEVAPNLPKELAPLREIAMNVWFSWNWDAIRLFVRLDLALWEKCYQNPVKMLGAIPQETLEQAARTREYVEEVRRVHAALQAHLAQPGWFRRAHAADADACIAYFSCEYGLSECFPIYGGGLGILSGDHLKTSSDLGIPLVGVGLLYQKGYFQQYLNLDGWQGERYPENDWYRMPVERVRRPDGSPLTVEVELAHERALVRIWKAAVGCVPLYLLDTNLPENPPHIRQVTHQLYGGDRENRIRQEMVLGVGGVRALAALGLRPTVFHMNEGHSAFLAVERLRALVEGGHPFATAREIVAGTNVFTTHTPVPAGNEHFDPDLVRRYMAPFLDRLGLSWGEFCALGQEEPGRSPTFCMTVLALNLSSFSNGVAEIHAATSREMWRRLWPGLPVIEVPIVNVSNGVHPGSWLCHEWIDLFREKTGSSPVDAPDDPARWEAIDRIDDADLWRVREVRRHKLVLFARKRLEKQLRARGADVTVLRAARETLDPKALTIGFARRFATYKRAGLLFRDVDRLARLLGDAERPVQILVAGKAHPADQKGKEIIRQIVHHEEHDPRFRGRLIFLEDYDINVARYLIQGADVWLNTPRRPMEASGTSGMKAVMNGGLHLSTLDGWWADAYAPEHGWAIGGGEVYESDDERDFVEGEALYNLLEREVVPTFYDRDAEGLPRRWLKMVRASMKRYGAFYSTDRMLKEYVERAYLPVHRQGVRLTADGAAAARALAERRRRIAQAWGGVSLEAEIATRDERRVGDEVVVVATVRLGPLTVEDVVVEAYHGPLNAAGEIESGSAVEMAGDGAARDGEARFRVVLPCLSSGRHGAAIRVRPRLEGVLQPLTPFLMTWEAGS